MIIHTGNPPPPPVAVGLNFPVRSVLSLNGKCSNIFLSSLVSIRSPFKKSSNLTLDGLPVKMELMLTVLFITFLNSEETLKGQQFQNKLVIITLKAL